MITQKRLKELLSYDEDSGVFVWIKKPSKKTKNIIGKVAGNLMSNGYLRIKIDYVDYLVHRLAWLYVQGEFPEDNHEIDHVNHTKTDNRFLNLREVSHKTNMKNLSKSKNNTSGVQGVYWHSSRNRWVSRIMLDRKMVHLGNFIVFSDAVDARKNAEVLYDFHENHSK